MSGNEPVGSGTEHAQGASHGSSDVGSSGSGPSRARRVLVPALAVLSVLFLMLSSVGFWASRTALNTDVFVDRVGGLGGDARVQTALADWLTDEVFSLLDVEGYLEGNLPPPADVLSVPLTSAVKGFVNDRVKDILATDAFATLWRDATERAHQAFVAVAEGDTPNISRQDEKIIVNLLPIVGQVIESLSGASPQLVAKVTSTLESLASDPPEKALQALEQATGITLPKDFGVLVVDDGGVLGAVRTLANLSRIAMIGLIVAFVATTFLAVWLSPTRRRTGVQLLGAFAVAIGALRQVAVWLEDDLVAGVSDPTNREAAEAVVGSVVSGLVNLLAFLLFVVIAVAVGLWVTRRRDDVVALWQRRSVPANWWHTPAPAGLQIGVAIGATALLWWSRPAPWFVALVVLVTVVAELFLWRTERRDAVSSAV